MPKWNTNANNPFFNNELHGRDTDFTRTGHGRLIGRIDRIGIILCAVGA